MGMNTCLSNDKGDVEIQGGGVQAQVPHVNIKLGNSTGLVQSSNGGGETFGVREDTKLLCIRYGVREDTKGTISLQGKESRYDPHLTLIPHVQ